MRISDDVAKIVTTNEGGCCVIDNRLTASRHWAPLKSVHNKFINETVSGAHTAAPEALIDHQYACAHQLSCILLYMRYAHGDGLRTGPDDDGDGDDMRSYIRCRGRRKDAAERAVRYV